MDLIKDKQVLKKCIKILGHRFSVEQQYTALTTIGETNELHTNSSEWNQVSRSIEDKI